METETLRLAIPKGKMYDAVIKLLSDAGITIENGGRSLRPRCSDASISVKLLKPQNIPQLLERGNYDIGFSGRDWVIETASDVIELLDTRLAPVLLVATAPIGAALTKAGILLLSEYENVAKRWATERKMDCTVLRSWGATEAFPPEDADIIIDNTASGQTLKENGLTIIDTLFESSTVFLCNKQTLGNPAKRLRIERLTMLLKGVLEGRYKCLLEMNVAADKLAAVNAVLPAARSPTIATRADGGYAIKGVVLRSDVATIIIACKQAGATDILEYDLNKVIP